MDITMIVRTLTPLADALEFYGIPYHLTGSLASSVYVKAQAVQGIAGDRSGQRHQIQPGPGSGCTA